MIDNVSSFFSDNILGLKINIIGWKLFNSFPLALVIPKETRKLVHLGK